jgi:hypothetical protein
MNTTYKRWIVEYDDGSLRIYLAEKPLTRKEAESLLNKEMSTIKVVSLMASAVQNLDKEAENLAGMRTVQHAEISHNFITNLFTKNDVDGMVFDTNEDGEDIHFNLTQEEFDRLRNLIDKNGLSQNDWDELESWARDVRSGRKDPSK